jgi:hypothetical protein
LLCIVLPKPNPKLKEMVLGKEAAVSTGRFGARGTADTKKERLAWLESRAKSDMGL